MARFVFRSKQIIGAADAESDKLYLGSCFVDTGDLAIIRDCNDPRNILVGRTGTGKSALLSMLADHEEHVIPISPESLSLSYVANSGVLKFFATAGVALDIFYRLLWKHVLCVEIIKEKYGIYDEEKKQNFLKGLLTWVAKDTKRQKSLDYLRDWGEDFWKNTEYRVKEVTTKLEKELKGAVDGKIPVIGSWSASAARSLTEEQKAEVIHLTQEVVEKVQVRQLEDVIVLVGEFLDENRQQQYYVTIDKLDEDWVDDHLRLRLIRALIQTSIEFSNRIKNLKVVVAVRRDLLDRVYTCTRDAGFQEEKYRTSSLDITWDKNRLIDVVDTRINALMKSQYTDAQVGHEDILVKEIRKQPTIDYMIDRTLMRPRDIIQFFNECIKRSDGKTSISQNAVREAEGIYSRERLRALFDEWYGLYPNLSSYFPILKNRKPMFSVGDILLSDIEDAALSAASADDKKPGADLDILEKTCDGTMPLAACRSEVFYIFYKVGLVGLKTDPQSPFSWSPHGGVSVSCSEIHESTRVHVHKTFWRVLGVSDPSAAEESVRA